MSDWQVGDLAVCVDARVNPVFGPSGLREGATYTVSAVLPNSTWALDPADNGPGLEVHGVRCGGLCGFASGRFRKVLPDKHEACEDEFVILLKLSKQRAASPLDMPVGWNRVGL